MVDFFDTKKFNGTSHLVATLENTIDSLKEGDTKRIVQQFYLNCVRMFCNRSHTRFLSI